MVSSIYPRDRRQNGRPELYFAGHDNLVLVAADGASLGEVLKYEPSRDGDLFPHLYGSLPLTAVLWVRPLPLGADGHHIFPEDVEAPDRNSGRRTGG